MRSTLSITWVRAIGLCVGAAVVLGATGCVNIKAPERIEIANRRPAPVDSSRVPATSSHEHARQELTKAYQQIQYLEHENARLDRKAADYKRERDEVREQAKQRRSDD